MAFSFVLNFVISRFVNIYSACLYVCKSTSYLYLLLMHFISINSMWKERIICVENIAIRKTHFGTSTHQVIKSHRTLTSVACFIPSIRVIPPYGAKNKILEHAFSMTNVHNLLSSRISGCKLEASSRVSYKLRWPG